MFFPLVRRIFFLSIFILYGYGRAFAETSPVSYAIKQNNAALKAGGRLYFIYGNGSEDSRYQDAFVKAGYFWSLFERDSEVGLLTVNFGGALQPYVEDQSRKEALILNDFSVSLRSGDVLLKTGRSLSAAGSLHNDLDDTGTPGAGSDNQFLSFWRGGGFSANVGQKLTAPYALRHSLYYYPFKNTEIGASYASRIDEYGSSPFENRARGARCGNDPFSEKRLTAGGRPIFTQFSESPACNEMSAGVRQNMTLLGSPVGFSFGWTQAESQLKGKIQAFQGSAFLERPGKGLFGADRKYQIVFGGMSGENLYRPVGSDETEADSRAGLQVTDRYQKLTVSYTLQTYRKNINFVQADGRSRFNTENEAEVTNGFQYEIGGGLIIGTEYSVRSKRDAEEEFLWSCGASLHF